MVPREGEEEGKQEVSDFNNNFETRWWVGDHYLTGSDTPDPFVTSKINLTWWGRLQVLWYGNMTFQLRAARPSVTRDVMSVLDVEPQDQARKQ